MATRKSWYFGPSPRANWKTLSRLEMGLLMAARLSQIRLNFLWYASTLRDPFLRVASLSFRCTSCCFVLGSSWSSKDFQVLYANSIPTIKLNTSSVITPRSHEVKRPSLLIYALYSGFGENVPSWSSTNSNGLPAFVMWCRRPRLRTKGRTWERQRR